MLKLQLVCSWCETNYPKQYPFVSLVVLDLNFRHGLACLSGLVSQKQNQTTGLNVFSSGAQDVLKTYSGPVQNSVFVII
jgi:hypothetical protein